MASETAEAVAVEEGTATAAAVVMTALLVLVVVVGVSTASQGPPVPPPPAPACLSRVSRWLRLLAPRLCPMFALEYSALRWMMTVGWATWMKGMTSMTLWFRP